VLQVPVLAVGGLVAIVVEAQAQQAFARRSPAIDDGGIGPGCECRLEADDERERAVVGRGAVEARAAVVVIGSWCVALRGVDAQLRVEARPRDSVSIASPRKWRNPDTPMLRWAHADDDRVRR